MSGTWYLAAFIVVVGMASGIVGRFVGLLTCFVVVGFAGLQMYLLVGDVRRSRASRRTARAAERRRAAEAMLRETEELERELELPWAEPAEGMARVRRRARIDGRPGRYGVGSTRLSERLVLPVWAYYLGRAVRRIGGFR